MKLKNIFKLYKSYYPSAEPYRVTIAGCGAVQVSDSRCASRLCVGAAPGVHRFLSDRDEVVRTGDNVSAALLGSYFYDNRREFFMMGETRSLYGIVYAENLTTDLQFMAMMRPASFSAGPTGGIRLTWLFALADCVSQSRYSLSSLTAAPYTRRKPAYARRQRAPAHRAQRRRRRTLHPPVPPRQRQVACRLCRRKGGLAMKLSRKVCDVASAYFPAPQKASSTRRLRRWIDSDPTLARALVRAGYRKGQHAFTPRQFKVLRRILGAP